MDTGLAVVLSVISVVILIVIGIVGDKHGWFDKVEKDSPIGIVFFIVIMCVLVFLVKNWHWILLIVAIAGLVALFVWKVGIANPFDRVGRVQRLKREQERRTRKFLAGRAREDLEEWETDILVKIEGHYEQKIAKLFE